MRQESKQKLSNYIDLFIFFIQVDIFIWVLFEIGRPFRPLVYDAGWAIVVLTLVELCSSFLFNPFPRYFLKRSWRHLIILGMIIYACILFSRVPASHKYLFPYSRIFLGFIELMVFVKFMLNLSRLSEIFNSFRVSPAQLIIFSFVTIILLGSFLLYLPYSRPGGTSMRYIDALFTSTSAVCVTGLVVVDTGTAFSRLGQFFIVFLIQAGGLGIMTIAAFIQVSLGSQMSVYGRFSTASFLGQSDLRNLYTIIRSIVVITFIFEAVGTLLFLPFFRGRVNNTGEAAFYSLFHAISAFCNAGFALYPDSFMGAKFNIPANSVLIILIVTGGFGFTVLLNLAGKITRGENERISVQTRMVVIASMWFLVIGGIGFWVFEKNHILAGMRPYQKIMASFFQSTTARTAGFNTIDTGLLRPITLFMLSILMFIGASPGSTGGGIKTTTFFILVLSIITIFRDQRFNTIFRRRIPFQVVNRAFAILIASMGVVIGSTLLLGVFEDFSFIRIYFEAVSAFGTVGLTTGITPHLSDLGKIIIMLTMFTGRLGPLTMVLAVRNLQRTAPVLYPTERLMVG
ncbi:MAG: TrkH family potassium uptake protein [Spirochaetota bacterium]